MKVTIKKFDVEMELKTKGMELDIYAPNGKDRIGDMVVTKTGVIWCKGKTQRKNGVAVSWNDLIALIENA